MESKTNTESKEKEKRQSKGMRKYIRRLKQAKRRESTLMVPKKKK